VKNEEGGEDEEKVYGTNFEGVVVDS